MVIFEVYANWHSPRSELPARREPVAASTDREINNTPPGALGASTRPQTRIDARTPASHASPVSTTASPGLGGAAVAPEVAGWHAPPVGWPRPDTAEAALLRRCGPRPRPGSRRGATSSWLCGGAYSVGRYPKK